MQTERFTWGGLLFRFLGAAVLVYATYNPLNVHLVALA